MEMKNALSPTTKSMASVENKAGRFVTLSIFIHASILTSVALMNAPSLDFSPKEVIEFEVDSPILGHQAIPDGKPTAETQKAPQKISSTDMPAAAAPVVTAAAPVTAPGTNTSLAENVDTEASPQVSESLDDIPTPELAMPDTSESPSTQDFLDDTDLEEAFSRVEQEQQRPELEAHSGLDEESEKLTGAVAAAETGSPTPTKEVFGIPGGVRTLEQLRQMPNNKFPEYSNAERLKNQEGQALFYAYVNKDGSLSQFKLGQSTGFRNLDKKTLAALKTWKFYPGQEGWVELPFKWTLAGKVKQFGGTLRK